MKIQGIKWTANFAYAVGLLTADGNLSSDRRHIIFVSKDIDLVHSFKYCLNLNNKISHKSSGYSKNTDKKYYFVQFGNVKLYDFLQKIGLTPNKSKNIERILLPPEYFPDFLRGLIDGDGSIGYFMHPASKEKQFRIRITSASKKFLEWLDGEIDKFLNINGAIRQVTRAYQLCYYKKASNKLANFIYYRKGVISLKRKFEVARLMKMRGW